MSEREQIVACQTTDDTMTAQDERAAVVGRLTDDHDAILTGLNDLQTWAAMMAGRAPKVGEALDVIQRARIHVIECRQMLSRGTIIDWKELCVDCTAQVETILPKLKDTTQ